MPHRWRILLLILAILAAVFGCVVNNARDGGTIINEGDRVTQEGTNRLKQFEIDLTPR